MNTSLTYKPSGEQRSTCYGLISVSSLSDHSPSYIVGRSSSQAPFTGTPSRSTQQSKVHSTSSGVPDGGAQFTSRPRPTLSASDDASSASFDPFAASSRPVQTASIPTPSEPEAASKYIASDSRPVRPSNSLRPKFSFAEASSNSPFTFAPPSKTFAPTSSYMDASTTQPAQFTFQTLSSQASNLFDNHAPPGTYFTLLKQEISPSFSHPTPQPSPGTILGNALDDAALASMSTQRSFRSTLLKAETSAPSRTQVYPTPESVPSFNVEAKHSSSTSRRSSPFQHLFSLQTQVRVTRASVWQRQSSPLHLGGKRRSANTTRLHLTLDELGHTSSSTLVSPGSPADSGPSRASSGRTPRAVRRQGCGEGPSATSHGSPTSASTCTLSQNEEAKSDDCFVFDTGRDSLKWYQARDLKLLVDREKSEDIPGVNSNVGTLMAYEMG